MATATVTKVIEIDVRQSAAAQANLKQVADGMKGLDDTIAKTGKSAQGSLDFITSGLKGMASGLIIGAITTGISQLGSKFVELSDNAAVLTARLKLVTGSQEAANLAFQQSIKIAVSQGQSLDAVGTLFEKIARNADNLGITQDGVTKITNSFAASLRLSGAGAQQAEAAILQFSQALASGKLSGDEYRSMTENNNVFMQELGKSAGKTMGEMKKMSSEGKIDLEFLREAFVKVDKDGKTMLDRLEEGAAKLPMTFKQAREGVVTQLINLVDALSNTADNSEGIFTRMAKNIANTFGQAAREVRLFANIQAAKAGKELPSQPGETDKEAFEKNSFGQISKLQDQNARLIEFTNGAKDKLGTYKSDASRNAFLNRVKEAEQMLKDNIAEIKARTADLTQFEVVNKKINTADMLKDNYKPPKDEPKKGKKASSALDPLIEFQNKMMNKDIGMDYEREGMGKNELALETALSKTTLKGKALIAVLDDLRPRVQALDKAAALQKYGDDVQDNMTKAYQAQVKGDNDLFKKLAGEGEKLNKKVDPLNDFLAKVQEVDDVLKRAREGGFPNATPDQIASVEAYRASLNDANRDMDKLANKGKTAFQQLADFGSKTADQLTDAFVSFASGTKVNFGSLIKGILADFAKLQLTEALAPAKKGAVGWLADILGTGASAAGANVRAGDSAAYEAAIQGFAKQANGGAWHHGVQMFANGGVVNGPTGFKHAGGMGVMGESGPEAIMPLQRDGSGKLGVGTAPVSVQIINQSGGKVSTSEGTDENGNKQIKVMVEQAVNEGFQKGSFDKTVGNTYGLSRRGQG